MGLFSLCFVGGAMVLIGVWEAIYASYAHLKPSSSSSSSSPNHSIQITTTTERRRRRTKPFSTVTVFAVFFLSLLCIMDSTVSSVDASHRKDRVGVALQLQTIAVSALFLLYAVVGILVDFTDVLPLPPTILSLIALFAFGQEFLLFYLQRKDPDGFENRYFDLLLVPIFVCFLSTLLELGSPRSPFPRLGRAAGLILQGTWFVQMGFSFYTDLMAHGCALLEKSRGNYTIKCKGHADGHRSMAIATLQFNCHLALLVAVVVGLYWTMGRNFGSGVNYSDYKPLSKELQSVDEHSHFTLDSDDEGEEIAAAEENSKRSRVLPTPGMNGLSNGNH